MRTASLGRVGNAATEASAQLAVENPLLMFDTIVEGTRRALDLLGVTPTA